MPPKNPRKTPKSQIKSALHKLFLRSRERGYAIKSAGYCCHECGVKQSKAKGREISVEIHHLDGINWELVYEFIYQQLLPDPSRLQALCRDCHAAEHEKEPHGSQNHTNQLE